jgi:hypothetical protein
MVKFTDEEIALIEKIASETSTTPIYISDKGDIFTATDLVKGQGMIGTGEKYKPKKYKAYSLAERVQSPDFGKVK